MGQSESSIAVKNTVVIEPRVKFLVEIVKCLDDYYWRLYNDKEEIVATSHKWYKSKSECIHAINVIGHHFKNAVIAEEVLDI